MKKRFKVMYTGVVFVIINVATRQDVITLDTKQECVAWINENYKN